MRVALGTWALGGGNDWGNTSDQAAHETLCAALDNGVRIIDTAPIYGAGLAEQRVGRAIKHRRAEVLLATKCGISLAGGRPDHDLSPQSIIAECEASLRRLQTDYIDVYQIHWPDPKVPLADSVEALARLQEQGKIRTVGVCNFSLTQVQQMLQIMPLTWVQQQFSLLQPKAEKLRTFCKEKGLALWAYGVLGGGILSGKYKRAPNFRRCDARRYFYKYYFGEGFARAARVAARVKQLADKKQVSSAAIALSWALYQSGVSGVLFGARCAKQVEENVQAAMINFTLDELDFLVND